MNYCDVLVQLPYQFWLKLKTGYDFPCESLKPPVMVIVEGMGEERKVEVSRGGRHQFSENWVNLFGLPAPFLLELDFVHGGHQV